MILILTRNDLKKQYKAVASSEVRQWMFKKSLSLASAHSIQTYFFSSPDEAGILLKERTTDSMMDEIRTRLRVPPLASCFCAYLANRNLTRT